ncbi:hypothetical protein [Thalassomonas sp. M1454]|uniref:hypothetical protein n=1 Tax=Thalassomonas sp. M1454 TaxID=2594477 RepID=UPI001180EC31|nr:hypothetical protein [Thalassomonas sp. M1454]TRX57165.1 hypothetical protein FNN08_06615 [Thalassomonas sp. M1454]
MKTSKYVVKVCLFSLSLLFVACGSEQSPTSQETNVVNPAPEQQTINSKSNSNLNLKSSFKNQNNTVTAIAGIESGLQEFAFIDDTISHAYRYLVFIEFSGNSKYSSIQGQVANCEDVLQIKNCRVYGNVTYKNPGTYSYTVSYVPFGTFNPVNNIIITGGKVVVKPAEDFVIVSIGDSVASGEGNPVIEQSGYQLPSWDDFYSNYFSSFPDDLGCHRSSLAGPALAANKIKSTNPATSFIHIACSGASLNNTRMNKTEPKYLQAQISKVNDQLDWVRQHVSRIDVLTISAGANNIAGGFGEVVTKCLLNNPLQPCSEDDKFKQDLRDSMDNLEVAYIDLQNRIHMVGEAREANEPKIPSVVVISEYFDPTRDSQGNFPSAAVSLSCGLGAISPAEWEFLYNEMVVPLNLEVADAAATHHWKLAGGIASAFEKHGYCASVGLGDLPGKSWIVKAPESVNKQIDHAGSAHPDYDGQIIYKNAIYNQILLANPPRTSASATADGNIYTFGTWVATDVELTLSAYNPIKESGVNDTYYSVGEPKCNAVSYVNGDCELYTGSIIISDSGKHEVNFFSFNKYDAPETRVGPVQVWIDKEPPEMTCIASPNEVWPPNKRMIEIEVTVTAVDQVSGPADYFLIGVSDSLNDEDNSMAEFELGLNDTLGMVLSDREGNVGSRYYTFTYQSEDAVGNVGTCDAVVEVPHDQRDNVRIN